MTNSSHPQGAPLAELVAALDNELEIDRFACDSSHNGLQVECSNKPIRRIVCGVDASLTLIARAIAAEADLIVVHHGLSWGDSLKRITGLNYRHLALLFEHDIALWAAHLPLDAHLTLGNNAQLAQALQLQQVTPFGRYSGIEIGIKGGLAQPQSREAFAALLEEELCNRVTVMPFGPAMIRSVGIISGGAATEVEQAAAEGLDAYLSGEATLLGYNLAEQLGCNAFFGGHYATERYGVAALAEWLSERFPVAASLVDLEIVY